MNFDHMPELHWHGSYPAVILAMAALEVLLYRMFKRQGWL
jgi:magnesium transporter